MQISGLFEALKRRVLPLLGVLLLATLAATMGWRSTQTVYDATAVAVVVPGTEPDQPGVPENPLNRVGYATTQLATLATVVAASPSLQQDVAAKTGAELLSANNTAQERTSAPQPGIQIVVTARGSTSDIAKTGADTATQLMDEQLAELQAKVGVKGDRRARIVPMLPAQSTASSSRSRLRAAGGLFLGTAALGSVAVLGFDAWTHRRRRGTAASATRLQSRGSRSAEPRDPSTDV